LDKDLVGFVVFSWKYLNQLGIAAMAFGADKA